MADADGAAQALDVLRRIGALDAIEAAFGRGRNEIVKISHGLSCLLTGACFERASSREEWDIPVTSFTLHRKTVEGIGKKTRKNQEMLCGFLRGQPVIV
jgi:hypothetical protein